MAINLITYEELKQYYFQLARAAYPDVDLSEYADFDAKGSAIAGMQARQALDAFRLFNAQYPQNGDSFGINAQLAAAGVSGQFPATPTFITATAGTIATGLIYNIPAGIVLTSNNGTLYLVLSPDGISDFSQLTDNQTTLQLVSIEKGTATNVDDGDILTFSPAQLPTDGSNNPINTLTVVSSVAGNNVESLGGAIDRLIELKQQPLNGSRATDFKYLALDPTNGVTDAVVLVNNKLRYGTTFNYNVGIFDVAGAKITDEILNKGLVTGTTAEVFDRSVPQAIYDGTQVKIVAEDIAGAFPICNTVNTQAITNLTNPATPYFKIRVVLQSGYNLNTVVQINGINLTIEQLIQREVRRAICGQKYGATLAQDFQNGAITASSISTSSIELQLDTNLGTPTTIGDLGNYLASRSILIYKTGSEWEYKASIPLNIGIPLVPTDPLLWVYDISTDPTHIYSNIKVELDI